MNQLPTKYHTQINNKILPYVSCGTTCLAEYISWLNIKWNKNYICDDDKVFEILNSQPIIDQANILIKKGIIDNSALDYRLDNPNTIIDESHYAHLNNFMELLAICGNYITNNEFSFQIKYQLPDEIKYAIDDDYPSLLGASFTKSGHFVLVVGYDDNDNLIVDDPYGNWNKSYSKETLGQGNHLPYNIKEIDKIVQFRIGMMWRIMRAYKV